MWFYRALLHLYPRGFRAEYGHDMGHIFAQRLSASSWAVRILLWLEAVAGIRQRAREWTREPQTYLPHQQVPDGWLTF